MCGRYVSPSQAEIERFWHIGARSKINLQPKLFETDYNAAPTRMLPVVRRNEDTGELETVLMRWGLVPHWAKELKFGNQTINARAETVKTKPSFRAAYKSRRCLIPAHGYYEWQAGPDGKQPHYFSAADGSLLAFAGLWEQWTPPEGGDEVQTFTIIVCAANLFAKDTHDRMPVILDRADWQRWLEGPDVDDLLKPARDDLLKRHPVSRAVNNSRSKGPMLIAPIGLDSIP
jgi:putative SOS response-associated peptidase YedK